MGLIDNAAWLAEYEAEEARHTQAHGALPKRCPLAVLLSVEVLAWLLMVADARNRGKSPLQSRRMSESYTDLQLDFLGVKGEYVVSSVYGVPFDSAGYGSVGDDGVDIRTPTPGAIKTNHRAGGYLLVERWRDLAKVAVVHLVDGPCDPPHHCTCALLPPSAAQAWRYIGWMSVDEFKAASLSANWGLGPRRYCRQAQLHQTLHRGTA